MSTPTDPVPTATPSPPNPVADALRRYWLPLLTFAVGAMLACPCGIVGGRWMAPRGDGGGVGVGPVGDGKGKGDPADKKGVQDDKNEWTWQKLQDHLAAKGMKTVRGQGAKGMWFDPVSPGDSPEIKLADVVTLEAVGIYRLEPRLDVPVGVREKLGKAYAEVELASRQVNLNSDLARNNETKPEYNRLVKSLADAEARAKKLAEQVAKSPVSIYQPFVVSDLHSPKAAKEEAARIKDVDQRDVLAWNRFVFRSHPIGLATLKKLLP